MRIVKILTAISALFIANGLVAQNVGIGTATPTEKIHVQGGARITNLSGVGNRLVQSNATGVLSNIPGGTNGQILTVVGGNYTFQNPQADNGLYYNTAVDRIRLGGPLVETTTITHGIYSLTHNLNSTGDFNVQDAGVTHFQVRDNGYTYFGDDTYWNDGSVTGTTIARLYDSGNDGVFQVYRNGVIQHSINSIGTTVFNEQGVSVDFRIESDLSNDIFFVDASTNRIGVNTTPTYLFHMTNGGMAVGAAPMARFDNSDVAGVAVQGYNQSAANGYNGIEGITSYNGVAFIPAGVFGLAIYNGGASSPTIGVRGATNEWQGVGVRGTRFNGGGPNWGWGGAFYDDLGYTGFFGLISDKRTKKDIQPIRGALDIVSELNPVKYNYDLEKYPTMGLNRGLEFGFIAQEVNTVLPEITRIKTFSTNACEVSELNVPLENKSEEFMVMDYTRLIPILTQAIKEQQEMIETMNEKIQQLELEVELLNEN